MIDPERDYTTIAGVIAVAMISILVFRCRKRDRDAGRRLLIPDVLVGLHTLAWIASCLLQPYSDRSYDGSSAGDPVFSWFYYAMRLLHMALVIFYILSVPIMILYLFFYLRPDDRKKLVLWEGLAIFAFYLVVTLYWNGVRLS